MITIYTNKKAMYEELWITRYEFESKLNDWWIIELTDQKGKKKWFIYYKDVLDIVLKNVS